jgi:hypothetical protein
MMREHTIFMLGGEAEGIMSGFYRQSEFVVSVLRNL